MVEQKRECFFIDIYNQRKCSSCLIHAVQSFSEPYTLLQSIGGSAEIEPIFMKQGS